jgi:hypothetical protein
MTPINRWFRRKRIGWAGVAAGGLEARVAMAVAAALFGVLVR